MTWEAPYPLPPGQDEEPQERFLVPVCVDNREFQLITAALHYARGLSSDEPDFASLDALWPWLESFTYLEDPENCGCWPDYTEDDAPFWENQDDVDAERDTGGTFWEYLGDWAVSAFLATTISPGAAIAYRTFAPRIRLAFRRSGIGGVARVLIDDVLVDVVDTYLPGASDLVNLDIDVSQFVQDNALTLGDNALEVVFDGASPDAQAAAGQSAQVNAMLEVVRKYLPYEPPEVEIVQLATGVVVGQLISVVNDVQLDTNYFLPVPTLSSDEQVYSSSNYPELYTVIENTSWDLGAGLFLIPYPGDPAYTGHTRIIDGSMESSNTRTLTVNQMPDHQHIRLATGETEIVEYITPNGDVKYTSEPATDRTRAGRTVTGDVSGHTGQQPLDITPRTLGVRWWVVARVPPAADLPTVVGPQGPPGATPEPIWQDTSLGWDTDLDGTSDYPFVELQGPSGPSGAPGPQGPEGPAGDDGTGDCDCPDPANEPSVIVALDVTNDDAWCGGAVYLVEYIVGQFQSAVALIDAVADAGDAIPGLDFLNKPAQVAAGLAQFAINVASGELDNPANVETLKCELYCTVRKWNGFYLGAWQDWKSGLRGSPTAHRSILEVFMGIEYEYADVQALFSVGQLTPAAFCQVCDCDLPPLAECTPGPQENRIVVNFTNTSKATDETDINFTYYPAGEGLDNRTLRWQNSNRILLDLGREVCIGKIEVTSIVSADGSGGHWNFAIEVGDQVKTITGNSLPGTTSGEINFTGFRCVRRIYIEGLNQADRPLVLSEIRLSISPDGAGCN